MRTVAVIQARLSSTRLPGKVLEDVAGRPLLWHVVERTRSSGIADEVVVATSVGDDDDAIEAYCRTQRIELFRGSLEDVLDRFVGAANAYRADVVLRVTSDCPMLDPGVVADVHRAFDPARHDYVSNTIDRTYPDGLDTEVVWLPALEQACREAALPSEREHVTPYIWKHPQHFRIGQVRQETDRSALRWTVDEPRDLEFVRAVFERIGRDEFGQDEVLALLRECPELAQLNAGIVPNEGYFKSLEADR